MVQGLEGMEDVVKHPNQTLEVSPFQDVLW